MLCGYKLGHHVCGVGAILGAGLVIVVAAIACSSRGPGPTQSTPTASVAVQEFALSREDIPGAWIGDRFDESLWDSALDKGNVQVIPADVLGRGQLPTGGITASDIERWKTIAAMDQGYRSSPPFPPGRPDALSASAVLHRDRAGAATYFDFKSQTLDRDHLEAAGTGPILDFEVLNEPAIGEASRFVRWTFEVGGGGEVEVYSLIFLRDRVVGEISVRGLRQAVALEDVIQVARRLDERIQQALERSLK